MDPRLSAPGASGIYAIHNSVNLQHYIGSAVSLRARMRDHFSKLRRGIHENKHLQNAFLKYGEGAFWAEIVEFVQGKADLVAREQFYLDSTRPSYNILRTARSGLGFKHSEEECKKISVRMKEKFASMSSEDRKILVASYGFTMKGRRALEETKAKISAANKGRIISEESKQKFKAWRDDPSNAEKQAASGRLRGDKKATVWYVVTDPDGGRHDVRNLAKFCRENGLSQAHMASASLGKKRGYKGWTCRYRDNPVARDESRKPRYDIAGKMLTVAEIAKLVELHKNTVAYHIKKGGIERILSMLG